MQQEKKLFKFYDELKYTLVPENKRLSITHLKTLLYTYIFLTFYNTVKKCL